MGTTTISSVGARLKFTKSMFDADRKTLPEGAVYEVVETETVERYPYMDREWVVEEKLHLELVDREAAEMNQDRELCTETALRHSKVSDNVELLN